MPDYTALFKRIRRANNLACDFEPPVKGSARRALGRCLLQGHCIALYREQKGTISYRYTSDSSTGLAAERARTGARTSEEAFLFADRYLRNKADALQGNPPQAQFYSVPAKGGPTIREAYDCIRRNLEAQFEEKQWREILKTLHCTEQVWCLDRPFASLSGRDVAQYIATRVEVGLSLPADFSRRPRLGPCKAVTAVNDLQVLAALCRKLRSEADVLTGETPFRVNPFERLLLPKAEKALRAKPTAERYEVLMHCVDRADPTGQLRLVLVLARWLGRRLSSIARLQRSDLRMTTAEMLETIRLIEKRGHQPRDGVQSETFAYEFVHGAVFFDRDRDKESFQRLVPNSALVRRETDVYLGRHPDLDPQGPLFPAAEGSCEPARIVDFIERLHSAEALARADGFEKEVPVLYNSVFHGFRGLRATEMENQQHRPAHVNFIIGWSCRNGSAKEDRYVLHDARLLYAAVEGMRPVEIEEGFRQAAEAAEEENTRLKAANVELNGRLCRMEEQEAAHDARMTRVEAQLGRMEALLGSLAAASSGCGS